MIVQEIRLENIDFADERFRIAYFRGPTALQPSIAAVGLLNPPFLWLERGAVRYTILCGFQRLAACRALGRLLVPARVYRGEDLPALEAFRMSLFDNLGVRALHPVEKAKVLQRLYAYFRLPGDVIVAQYHRLLDLAPQRPILDDYLRLAALPPEMQEALRRDQLSLPSAWRLARWAAPDAAALFRLITDLKLGVNRQRELLDWVEEIARTRGETPAAVVQQPSIVTLVSAEQVPPAERAEQVRQALRALRFPSLTQQEARFRSHLSDLGLDRGMHLTHDPLFENTSLKIEFPFASATELRAAAQRLLGLAENPALRKLLDLL